MLNKIIKECVKELLTCEKTVSVEGKHINDYVTGKICMIRTYSAGVHFGFVEQKEGQSVLLENSRRVYSWKGACSLSQLAMEGSKAIDECKIAMVVDSIQLDQVIEVITMTAAAVKNLSEAKEWKI